jgi:hypothetical protein
MDSQKGLGYNTEQKQNVDAGICGPVAAPVSSLATDASDLIFTKTPAQVR